MKKASKAIAIILSVLTLLTTLTACGELPEDEPRFKEAKVNSLQFDIATNAEVFNNVTVETAYGEEEAVTVYYADEIFYNPEEETIITFDGTGTVNKYQRLDKKDADYFSANFADGWGRVTENSKPCKSAGEYFTASSIIGTFDEYNYKLFKKQYFSKPEATVDTEDGTVKNRVLTFDNGVLVGLSYDLANGEDVKSVTVTFSDYGTTKPELPDGYQALCKPYGKDAVVNAVQFDAAAGAEAFNNVTVTTVENTEYTFASGGSFKNNDEMTDFYGDNLVYEPYYSCAYSFDGSENVKFYQELDRWIIGYYEDSRGKDYEIGWNFIETQSGFATNPGEYLLYKTVIGTYDDYSFDEASGKYVAKDRAFAPSGDFYNRTLTFKDGVLVEYSYDVKSKYGNGDSRTGTVVITFSDYGKTDVKAQLPEEASAVIFG